MLWWGCLEPNLLYTPWHSMPMARQSVRFIADARMITSHWPQYVIESSQYLIEYISRHTAKYLKNEKSIVIDCKILKKWIVNSDWSMNSDWFGESIQVSKPEAKDINHTYIFQILLHAVSGHILEYRLDIEELCANLMCPICALHHCRPKIISQMTSRHGTLRMWGASWGLLSVLCFMAISCPVSSLAFRSEPPAAPAPSPPSPASAAHSAPATCAG